MTRFDDFEDREEYNFRFGEPSQDGGREHHMVTHRLVCVCALRVPPRLGVQQERTKNEIHHRRR
jgi:hypothetical protein